MPGTSLARVRHFLVILNFLFHFLFFFYSSFFTKILILALRFSVEVKSIRARRSLESFLSLNFEVKLQVLDCQL